MLKKKAFDGPQKVAAISLFWYISNTIEQSRKLVTDKLFNFLYLLNLKTFRAIA